MTPSEIRQYFREMAGGIRSVTHLSWRATVEKAGGNWRRNSRQRYSANTGTSAGGVRPVRRIRVGIIRILSR